MKILFDWLTRRRNRRSESRKQRKLKRREAVTEGGGGRDGGGDGGGRRRGGASDDGFEPAKGRHGRSGERAPARHHRHPGPHLSSRSLVLLLRSSSMIGCMWSISISLLSSSLPKQVVVASNRWAKSDATHRRVSDRHITRWREGSVHQAMWTGEWVRSDSALWSGAIK